MQLPENLGHRDVNVNGETMHYVASSHPRSADPPIVLVHGIGLSHRYLVPMAQYVADDLPVYLPDLPGFGRSYKPRRILRLEELADWLADWMRELELQGGCVMGQSFGCQVVVHLAARHPDVVGRIVLQGMTVDPAARSMWKQFIRWRRNQRSEDKSRFPPAMPDYRRCGFWRILRTYKYGIDDRPEDVVPQIDCPALVVRGADDTIGSHAWHEEIARRLPRGQMTTVQGVGHTINVSAPKELARLVKEFCQGQEVASVVAARE